MEKWRGTEIDMTFRLLLLVPNVLVVLVTRFMRAHENLLVIIDNRLLIRVPRGRHR